MKGWQGFVKRYQFGQAIRLWETQTLSCQVEFKKLEDQAEFDEKVEPLYYVGMLIVAIIFTLMSLNMYYMISLNLISMLVPDFQGLEYNWFNMWAT
jgi:hypothetical protein